MEINTAVTEPRTAGDPLVARGEKAPPAWAAAEDQLAGFLKRGVLMMVGSTMTDLVVVRQILERTPDVLGGLLLDLPLGFATGNEGPGTWSPQDVIGHLILGERTDWIPRVEHLLRHGERVPFPAFDMTAHLQASAGLTLAELLRTFGELRGASLSRLSDLALGPTDLERRGLHPELGSVTLGQHLATWAAHDLDHLLQITRCLGRNFQAAVGPWQQYLRVVRES